MNSMACERVTLLMTTDDAPTMFVNPDGGDMTAVLMPMRV